MDNDITICHQVIFHVLLFKVKVVFFNSNLFWNDFCHILNFASNVTCKVLQNWQFGLSNVATTEVCQFEIGKNPSFQILDTLKV